MMKTDTYLKIGKKGRKDMLLFYRNRAFQKGKAVKRRVERVKRRVD